MIEEERAVIAAFLFASRSLFDYIARPRHRTEFERYILLLLHVLSPRYVYTYIHERERRLFKFKDAAVERERDLSRENLNVTDEYTVGRLLYADCDMRFLFYQRYYIGVGIFKFSSVSKTII